MYFDINAVKKDLPYDMAGDIRMNDPEFGTLSVMD